VRIVALRIQSVEATSGCCSWHSGVCGCSSGGRQICCDGSLSPSCTCGSSNYVAPKTYYWNGKSYITYSSYRQDKWNDIQDLYIELLGRPLYSQEEGNIYSNSEKSYYTIKTEIQLSDERQEYLDKNKPKINELPNYSETNTINNYSDDSQEEPVDNSGWYWVLGIGGFWLVAWLYDKYS